MASAGSRRTGLRRHHGGLPVDPRAGALALAIAVLFAPPSTADDAVETIVITAERREKTLEQAPMSVDVALGEDLDTSGVVSTAELPFRVPTMVFTTRGPLGQPYIRGVGSDLEGSTADPSIATFVDGVYQARMVAAVQDLHDVERVEVLKGPQGTLFGRNTTGGAVRVFTRDPHDDLEVGGDFGYGNYDALRFRGFLNAPLAQDAVFARVAGLVTLRDGFTKNLFSGRRLDDEEIWALRAKVRLLPAEDVSLLLSGDCSRNTSTRFMAPKLVEPLETSPAFLMGGTVPEDPRKVLYDTRNESDVTMWGIAARLDWDLSALSIRSHSAFRETDFEGSIDLDATEIPFLTNHPSQNSKAFTQEIQLASTGEGALQWLGGVFYLHEGGSQLYDFRFGIVRDELESDTEVNAVGVFGEASYALGESWRATAGLRYSYEHKSIDFLERVNGGIAAAYERADDWDAWTPRFVLEYRPLEELLVYASVSRGFKSGGYNGMLFQPEPFDPEFLWAFQLGSRASLWGERVRLHAALFYCDYQDMQLQVISDLAVVLPKVLNAGAATIWGAELDWRARLFGGFYLEGAAAYLDASFDDLDAVDPHDPTASTDQSGNRLPNAPEFSIWLAADYPLELPFGVLTPRIDYSFQSEIYFDVFENRYVRQGAYGLLNARITFEDHEQRYFAALFARNLTDELYRQSNLASPGVFGNAAFWGPPRTYGFQVGLRYF
jgi:iron complex outermembrane receptor protein